MSDLKERVGEITNVGKTKENEIKLKIQIRINLKLPTRLNANIIKLENEQIKQIKQMKQIKQIQMATCKIKVMEKILKMIPNITEVAVTKHNRSGGDASSRLPL